MPDTVSAVPIIMGLCGTLLRVSAYVLVALVAVLAYFHLECQNEKEAETEQKSKFDPFDPKQGGYSIEKNLA